MKRYSLTDPLPDSYPMTPPDEPLEPDLSQAQDCGCGSKIDLIWEVSGYGEENATLAVHCLACKHTGPSRQDKDEAIDAWNAWNRL